MKARTDDLRRILNLVKPGVGKGEVAEQTSHFLFTGTHIATYNERISVRHPFNTDFSLSVKADDFFKLLKTIKDGEIGIDMGDASFVVKSESTEAEFPIFTTDVNGVIQIIESLETEEKKWFNLPKDFLRAVEMTAFSASKDASKGPLTCLYFNGKEVLSADSSRFSRYTMDGSVPTFLLRARDCKELLSYPVMKGAVTDAWVHFLTDDAVMFSARRIDGEFTEIPGIFSPTEKAQEIEAPKELKEAVDAVSMMAESDMDQRMVEIIYKSGQIVVEAASIGRGKVRKKIPFPHKGKTIKFFAHPELFSQILDKALRLHVDEELCRAWFVQERFSHVMSLSYKE